ncbi:MAG: hypothetical protein COA90_02630 [Gammaproteobacteria bacterium]|nr:MAG: hypothetical protein COA90_02630 [Gammaproteobacteria bacterium]
MYSDRYFPTHLVDKLHSIILDTCTSIETDKPDSLDELYSITYTATGLINNLQLEFEQHGSRIETVAKGEIAIAFRRVANMYGFDHANVRELLAHREW